MYLLAVLLDLQVIHGVREEVVGRPVQPEEQEEPVEPVVAGERKLDGVGEEDKAEEKGEEGVELKVVKD